MLKGTGPYGYVLFQGDLSLLNNKMRILDLDFDFGGQE